jgi:hypothetical protein
VMLGLCSQIDLDNEVRRASKGRAVEATEPSRTLLPAEQTTAQPEQNEAPVDDRKQNIDANSVFAKLGGLKRSDSE